MKERGRAWEVGETLYRAAVGIAGFPIHYREFEVLRLTEKGGWIQERLVGDEMWRTFHTVFAWPTKELADASLRIRTRRRVGYLRRELEEAEAAARALGVYSAPDLLRAAGLFEVDR